MPIEYHEENTGIYQRGSLKASDSADMECLVRWNAELTNVDYQRWLDAVDIQAWTVICDTADPLARCEARGILALVRALRAGSQSEAEKRLTWLAYRVGRAAERLHVRPFEPHAKRGAKEIRDSQAGHVKAYGTRDEKARQRKERAELWIRLRADSEYENWKNTALDAKVGQICKVSAKTIQRARLEHAKKQKN